ncbi:LysM peptidoglycan-binding domain-containing protein [Pseudidiomarina terrestris]|uniref:LysM peptidoglycan-binding domain-containing protein n=1 Tax=Pseudidiomarina terrestris TaxID=2820060 RepID=A0AAW7QYV2_9GAMM|nr:MULTISPECIES: LysM domain-containing protein [unclassified Pseudidiomarina]MDN7125405.1 LysM peptidoglycan-binding domain-containing protein [Pseudidiomarina sp. 1APP75-32.1]MDN7128009.1 LysM peptidoglycan-binding domain-containing protein [Pseudidiomarina sp. 1APR75-33.1]MDN7130163.1 LysM peptidoglycan-binding domain-containing protein [Pseudidiomarina sp. 1APR75-15]MDN7135668.1 LysM peptidoglycan-binding domain-containing protein [Pseudidiomarina sp. 1ASP75-5]MDN7137294.1 LysM peptidoglyc
MATWRYQAIAVIGFLLIPSATASAPLQNETSATSMTSGDVIQLREDAPREYVVKKGDTLWDISALFLNDPWHWPELWRLNDDIENPHLIYPGDRLYLSWVNGRPQLSRKEFKSLTPEGVLAAKGNPVPTFDRAALAPFIDGHHIVSATELAGMPRILGDNRGAPRINGMAPVYIDGAVELNEKYRVFTPVDEIGNSFLLRDVAGVRVTYQHADTIEGDLIKPKREIRRGDVVLPPQETKLPEIIVASSGAPVDGFVVGSLGDAEKHGKYDIVVLDKGSMHGVAVGQMFQALRPGVDVFTEGLKPEAANLYKPYDDISRKWRDTQRLPPRATSELLVIKTYSEMSMAIVVDAHEWFEVGVYFMPLQLASDR